jgi:hypothetical protein
VNASDQALLQHLQQVGKEISDQMAIRINGMAPTPMYEYMCLEAGDANEPSEQRYPLFVHEDPESLPVRHFVMSMQDAGFKVYRRRVVIHTKWEEIGGDDGLPVH